MSEPNPSAAGSAGGAMADGMAQRRRPFSQRLLAAFKLDATLYEEVEHDPDALGQATAVVALAGVAAAIGALGTTGAGGWLAGLVSAFVTWILWTTLVWIVGVKIFGHTSDFEELLRTLGFVAAPQILYILAAIPVPIWHVIVALGVLIMSAIAFVRAVRQALDVDTGRALLVALLALLAHAILAVAFGFARFS